MDFNYIKRKFIHRMTDLPVGGAWGRGLAAGVQTNLRWLWFDGLFSSASDNIILNFISLYILFLGASAFQIGLMSSISSFTAALMLFWGAILAERNGHHKEISVLAGGGFGRLCVLLLIFVPILAKGSTAVWIAISLAILRDAFGNLGYPSWVSVITETVPLEGRGRYFGSRNFVMGIAGIVSTLTAGKIITLFVNQTGYQIALGLAFVLGIASTTNFFKLIILPKVIRPRQSSRLSFHMIRGLLSGQPQFVALMLTAGFWNFAINVSGPFFNVHMVKDLHFSASTVGLVNVVMSLTGLLVLNRVGFLADRIGPRKLQLFCMILIPILPIMWVFASQPWHTALINTLGGILWAAFNLASFNLMLNSIPRDQVPRYSAIYQIMVTLSLALGAFLGSALISRYSFAVLLIVSAVFRWISVGFFARFVREPRQEMVEPG